MDHLSFQMEGYSMTAKIAIVDKPIKADITDVADWFFVKRKYVKQKDSEALLLCGSMEFDSFRSGYS